MMDTSSLLTAQMAVHAALGFGFGALLGVAYFQSLWWNVQLLTNGSAWVAIGLHLLRFCVLIVSLYVTSRYGAVTLISAAFGMITARSLVLRRARRLQ